jgi:hypothetical protein
VVAQEKTIVGVIERGMPSNHEIVFERESEQRPGMIPGNVVMRLVQQPHRTFRYRRLVSGRANIKMFVYIYIYIYICILD